MNAFCILLLAVCYICIPVVVGRPIETKTIFSSIQHTVSHSSTEAITTVYQYYTKTAVIAPTVSIQITCYPTPLPTALITKHPAIIQVAPSIEQPTVIPNNSSSLQSSKNISFNVNSFISDPELLLIEIDAFIKTFNVKSDLYWSCCSFSVVLEGWKYLKLHQHNLCNQHIFELYDIMQHKSKTITDILQDQILSLSSYYPIQGLLQHLIPRYSKYPFIVPLLLESFKLELTKQHSLPSLIAAFAKIDARINEIVKTYNIGFKKVIAEHLFSQMASIDEIIKDDELSANSESDRHAISADLLIYYIGGIFDQAESIFQAIDQFQQVFSSYLTSLPSLHFKHAESCPICRISIGNAVSLRCGHFYHQSCIFKWLMHEQRLDCPLCRQLINSTFSRENLALQQKLQTLQDLLRRFIAILFYRKTTVSRTESDDFCKLEHSFNEEMMSFLSELHAIFDSLENIDEKIKPRCVILLLHKSHDVIAEFLRGEDFYMAYQCISKDLKLAWLFNNESSNKSPDVSAIERDVMSFFNAKINIAD